MSHETRQQFGLLIAYFVPGFVAVVGIAPRSPLLENWLGMATAPTPTVGGFLFITVASIAAGLLLSTLRWLVLDTVHALTGLAAPNWDFRQLQTHVEAFELAIDHHYRYYQFYGNSLMAVFAITVARWPLRNVVPGFTGLVVLSFILLAGLFFAASRDSLRKYYARATSLLQDSNPGETS
jgi:hypothetical protein